MFKASELGRPVGDVSNSLCEIPHLGVGGVVLKQRSDYNSCSVELVEMLDK